MAKVAETSGFSALIYANYSTDTFNGLRGRVQAHRHSWLLLTASSHLTHLIAQEPDLGGKV